MLGSGMQFGRNYRGDDRFYVPFNGRRTHRNIYQQKEQEEQVRRAQSEMVVARQSALTREKMPVVVLPLCNLDRFLQTVTPSVPARFLSQATMRGWRTCDEESQPYFELGDLWESFNEWSAYGAGVPLILNGTNSVIHYYVPYLSGLQIYRDSTKTPVKSRHDRQPGKDSNSDYLRNLTSDGSCVLNLEQGLDRLSLTHEHITRQVNFSSHDGEFLNSQRFLLFEYFEREPPYSRVPLADKISDLTFQCPELKTLRSCDLLPSSWISVAWYPIYRIPTGPTLKDLDPCFLTFHSLHTPVRAVPNARPPVLTYPSEDGGIPRISLPIFGMATYKFRGSLWSPKGGSEHQLVNSLLQAAGSWLRLLQVNHPDFLFFSRR